MYAEIAKIFNKNKSSCYYILSMVVFHWLLSDSKFYQVSMIFLSATDFNSGVIWVVLVLPLISCPPSLFSSIIIMININYYY